MLLVQVLFGVSLELYGFGDRLSVQVLSVQVLFHCVPILLHTTFTTVMFREERGDLLLKEQTF